MIRLLIADDHTVMREGLKNLFELTDDIKVKLEATDGAEVIDRLRNSTDIDLILLDFTMPGVSGIGLIAQIKAAHPALPILVFSMHDQLQIVSRSIEAGASGFVVKDSNPDILLKAIRTVFRGGKFIDPRLAEQLAYEVLFPEIHAPHTTLSDREFEVFRMLIDGKPVNEIADQLAISSKTVSTHKAHLMEKIHVGSMADLVRYAVQHNLFTD